jgi:hypothetical protein
LSFINRHPGSGGVRPVVGSVAAVLALLVVLVLPASAHEGPGRLYDASVTPRTGTPSTTIAFAVTYSSHDDRAPDYVRVLIDGKAHQMAADGRDWRDGVVFRYSTTLDVGHYEIVFEAADRHKDRDREGGGTVRIKDAPTPEPTREPTPDPTPAPTPRAEPTPKAEPTRSSTPQPTADRTPTPDPTRTPRPTATPQTAGGGGTKPGGTPAAGSDDDPDGDLPAAGGAIDDRGAGHGGSDGSADGGTDPISGEDGWGALAAALDTVGLGPDAPFLSLTPTLVGTTGAVTMAMAFAIFGKKRRDEEQPAPDEVLRAQAARGPGVASTGELVRAGVGGPAVLVHGVVRSAAVPMAADAESTMPRWRRPSLIEARKADPRMTLSVSQHMSFDDSRVEPAQGYERRIIRYRVVRLLDAPDELRSTDIGQLDQGDEVQLIEKWGAYWLVLCPDGRQGWLHKMTLGDVVDAQPSPTAAEAFGGNEIDADVLAAFMAARARA